MDFLATVGTASWLPGPPPVYLLQEARPQNTGGHGEETDTQHGYQSGNQPAVVVTGATSP